MNLYLFHIFIFLIFLYSSAAASNQDIEIYKKSWTANALKLQRQIDLNTPFNRATFIGTHNSANSKSYAIKFIRYVDPNQTLSVYDQLELGVRSLEFDVHWTMGRHLQKDILLCHALENHLGCSLYDRPVVEGLQELQKWLSENPKEIVILYFDRVLDGHEPRLAAYLDQYLGEFIYKPSLLKQPDDHRCVSIPTTTTKNDILKNGKQILIVAKHCDGIAPSYEEEAQFPFIWNDYVFAGIGNVPEYSYEILDTKLNENFKPYPECDKLPLFPDDPTHLSMWRVFEDRTKLSNAIEKQQKILADDIKQLIRCGINLPAVDMLTIADERLSSAIWSWAPSYPKEGLGRCAIFQKNEGVVNFPCEKSISAFACKNEHTQQFKSVLMTGLWTEGESICQMVGDDWHFAMPINGYEMMLLKDAMLDQSQTTVALAYSMDDSNQWAVTSIKF